MTNDLTVPQQEPRDLTQRMTPAQMKADYNLVLQTMQSCMEKDTDYGVIPGTPKPTLYKPGAEKLMLVFRLASRPAIEDLSTEDKVRYRVSMEIIHHPTGTVIAYGVGEASTDEAKWKWRKAIKAEWDETPEDRRRKKHAEARDGKAYVTLQVRTEPADLANTVLKMADKRALISGVLKATAASSAFTQDLEEMDKDMREAVAQAEEGTMPPPIKTPQRKSEAQQPPASAPAAATPPPADKEDWPLPPEEQPKKAPDSFIPMDSKKDGIPCETCKTKIAMGVPIWFDKVGRRGHCRQHFA